MKVFPKHTLQINQVTFLRHYVPILKNIQATFESGHLYHLTGNNGAGKSTLLRLLTGITRPHQGTIHFDEIAIHELTSQYHQKLLYLGHELGLKEDLTPIENLRFSAMLHQHTLSTDTIIETLKTLELEKCHRPLRYLSAGQRRRVALARLCTESHKPIWILDEPFTALDHTRVEWLAQCCLNHLRLNGMIILTAHHALPTMLTADVLHLNLQHLHCLMPHAL